MAIAVDPFAFAADVLDPPTDRHLHDPVGWINEELHQHVWSKQAEIVESVRDNRYTACRSAHSTGKSHIAAAAIAWWLSTRSDAFAVTTAPTAPQIKAILWRYIKRFHREAGLRGRITDAEIPEWKIDGEIVGWGRKPKDLGDSEQAMQAFQGIHGKYVLVVLDEACGVPDWLWDAVDTLVTAPENRVLAIGNPDDPTSRFAKVCRPGSGWNSLKISAFDTPAFTGEDVPPQVADLLISKQWVGEREERWGKDSPLYVSKVEAEFPEVTTDTVIPLGTASRAQEREITVDPMVDLITIGVDVARFGIDETVIAVRIGNQIRLAESYTGAPLTETTERVEAIAREFPRPAVRIVVDDPGVGGGVTDMLRASGWPVTAFNGAMRARVPHRYRNRRDEEWFEAAKRLQVIDLDKDEQLAADLTSPRFKFHGLIRIVEGKDETKKRLGRSPDRADAVLLTLVEAEAPGAIAKPERPYGPQQPSAERHLSDADLWAAPM